MKISDYVKRLEDDLEFLNAVAQEFHAENETLTGRLETCQNTIQHLQDTITALKTSHKAMERETLKLWAELNRVAPEVFNEEPPRQGPIGPVGFGHRGFSNGR